MKGREWGLESSRRSLSRTRGKEACVKCQEKRNGRVGWREKLFGKEKVEVFGNKAVEVRQDSRLKRGKRKERGG